MAGNGPILSGNTPILTSNGPILAVESYRDVVGCERRLPLDPMREVHVNVQAAAIHSIRISNAAATAASTRLPTALAACRPIPEECGSLQ